MKRQIVELDADRVTEHPLVTFVLDDAGVLSTVWHEPSYRDEVLQIQPSVTDLETGERTVVDSEEKIFKFARQLCGGSTMIYVVDDPPPPKPYNDLAEDPADPAESFEDDSIE